MSNREEGIEEGGAGAEEVPKFSTRGFSGAPKFSDFKRTAGGSNTPATGQDAKASKDAKGGTKARGLPEYDDVIKPYSMFRDRPIDEDDGDDDEDKKENPSILGKVAHGVEAVTEELKTIGHEVKAFYKRSLRDDDDS